ncbi:MAG: PQQ-binding-like beta-propeller repeat protein, partial [Acidobacteriota bacterium]
MPTKGSVRSWLLLLILCIFGRTSIPISAPSETVLQDDAERISDWPQFRGRNVDGIVNEKVFEQDRPVILDLNWKVKLGSGYSGISIKKDLAVTMFDDGEFNVIAGFNAVTGQELWRFPVSPKYQGHDGSFDGPLSTPLIYNNHTIALGPSGRLFALNNLDGTLVWSTDLVKDHGAVPPRYGFATSPIVEEGTIVLQIGSKNGAIAGFDPETGKRRWITGNDFVDYQNAVPIARNGDRFVLSAGAEAIMGINPSSGDVLWRYDHGGGGSRGIWCMVPVPAGPDHVFLAYKNDSSALIELDGRDTNVTGRQVWEERTIRNSYNVAVYHEGYLYAYSSRFLTCVDMATGKAMWKSRQPGDGFLILVDGHLVILTKEGSL